MFILLEKKDGKNDENRNGESDRAIQFHFYELFKCIYGFLLLVLSLVGISVVIVNGFCFYKTKIQKYFYMQ